MMLCFIWVIFIGHIYAQAPGQNHQVIHKISTSLLSGKGLSLIKQKDTTRVTYQKKVYDGKDLAIYMVAIGTGITNKFNGFPMEEFIYWMNGKAVVEPDSYEAFAVQSGDYFVQAKGYQGKWNFIDNGGLHLELALIAKNRPDSSIKSSIPHAMIIDRDVISGVADYKKQELLVYEGVEITVNRLSYQQRTFKSMPRETMIHVLSGSVTVSSNSTKDAYHFDAGDFFVIPEGFNGTWQATGLQDLRVFEVFKTKR